MYALQAIIMSNMNNPIKQCNITVFFTVLSIFDPGIKNQCHIGGLKLSLSSTYHKLSLCYIRMKEKYKVTVVIKAFLVTKGL